MSLPLAIEKLEAEIAALGHGTPQQPREGTVDWFLLRAKALGLSSLRAMHGLKLSDSPPAAERFYRETLRAVKTEIRELPSLPPE